DRDLTNRVSGEHSAQPKTEPKPTHEFIIATVRTCNGPRAVKNNDLDSLAVPFSSIPVIDFSAMYSDDSAAGAAVGEAVRRACTEVGFFY
ncbi:2-oxoglutarate and iron-dependent oxygenase domain-containing protein, partial [Wenyingzhuangia sp. 1_MG-2023]|nr:2-oxoglutarate and iron-dependent oxygenase domain-containing protein [Wenyingzhuangia sp. 1_MG-2023]